MASASEMITKLDPFVVTVEALRFLETYLQEVKNENEKLRESHHRDEDFAIEYEVDLEGGSHRKFTSLDDVLKLGNHQPRRITEMMIGLSFPPGTSVRMAMGGVLVMVQCSIRGRESAVTIARQKCEEFCTRIHSPFAWMYSRWWYYLTGFTAVATSVAGGATLPKVVKPTDYIFFGGLVTLATLLILGQLRGRIFPKQLFAIGGEAQRFETIKDAQKRGLWLIAGLVLTSAVGFLLKHYLEK